jgi:hypothetical protein
MSQKKKDHDDHFLVEGFYAPLQCWESYKLPLTKNL